MMKSLAVWLVLAGLLFALFRYVEEGELSGADLLRALPPADTSAVEGLDGLGYLNYLRKEAGLPALAKSELLERSARNHARYLTDYPDEGHDEKHTASPLFSGETPSDRAASVGYPYGGVRENVSTGRIQRGASSGGDTVRQQADGLMAAVYHRFSLLEQGIDEAGAAYEEQNGNQALVVNQGNSLYRKLCASGRLNAEPDRPFYADACTNGAIVYADEMKPRQEIPYVVYPLGNSAVPEFYGERPDPVPDRAITGNPASIAFSETAGRIEMQSFKLYRGDEEVAPVRVLTRRNDPNRKFTDRQFALFPLNPLEYDTAYRAVFRYSRNGQKAKAEWTFRTKRPDYPYFIVKGGEKLAVSDGIEYFIRPQRRWCLKDCPDVVYQTAGGATLEVLKHMPGGIVVRMSGRRGDKARLMLDGGRAKRKAVELYLTD